ncbi:nucleotidyltransferase family protein [Paenibacillus sp. IB182496]|uniref:Nucleotidyltransferase family protein n=1 Tax=Paenibacillus sabuli TaxID=2772509 RepID=A0A927GQC2_9BACL|nr:nucleotidyltransferase family protein [Paenibacillus sabuli]MBD2843735.1 nucleotidyltransferase family protein [Paenibacillus sabuli]
MDGRIWALMLAAGRSVRMGEPKLLLPAPEGTVLRQSLRRIVDAAACRVALVAAHDGPVRPADAGDVAVEWIGSERSHLGLGASLAVGVRALAERFAPDAVVVVLGDQPELNPAVLRRVVAAYRESRSLIVQARYSDRPGHPVLFDSTLLPELAALSGDSGARAVLRRHAMSIRYVDVAAPAPRDIDTPADYAAYRARLGLARPEH